MIKQKIPLVPLTNDNIVLKSVRSLLGTHTHKKKKDHKVQNIVL